MRRAVRTAAAHFMAGAAMGVRVQWMGRRFSRGAITEHHFRLTQGARPRPACSRPRLTPQPLDNPLQKLKSAHAPQRIANRLGRPRPIRFMHPYTQLWLLDNAPTALPIVVWVAAAASTRTRARWAWLAASVAGSAAFGLEVATVLAGGATSSAVDVFHHVGWIGLAAALVLTDRRRARAHLWTFVLAAGAAAVHAWLLGLALVVTGHPERSRMLRVGISALLIASWSGEHLAWRGFDLLGRAGMTADAAGLVQAWINGLTLLVGWVLTVIALERLRMDELPMPRPPPAASD